MSVNPVADIQYHQLHAWTSSLSNEEAVQILGPILHCSHEEFIDAQLSLQQIAVLSCRENLCKKMMDRLPNISDEELCVMARVAPPSCIGEIVERLYPRQQLIMAPHIEPMKLPHIAHHLSTATLLAMMPLLNPEQTASLVPSLPYKVMMSVLPLLSYEQALETIPRIDSQASDQLGNELSQLPQDVSALKMSNVPPAQIALVLCGNKVDESLCSNFIYFTAQQIRFATPFASPENLIQLVMNIKPSFQQILLQSINEKQTIEILPILISLHQHVRERLGVIEQNSQKLKQEFQKMQRHKPAKGNRFSDRIRSKMHHQLYQMRRTVTQLIHEGREQKNYLEMILLLREDRAVRETYQVYLACLEGLRQFLIALSYF